MGRRRGPPPKTSQSLVQTIRNARPLLVLVTVVLLSVTMAGKRQCFCVLVAHLQNSTCNSLDKCSLAALNWIGDLCPAIAFAGTPVITNLLVRYTGPNSPNLILQFGLVITFGCITTSFVSDPESLAVTDSIIQGIGSSAIISVVALKLETVFPKEHRYHVLATALADGGPIGTIFFCPLYAAILTHSHWQAIYLVMAAILLLECLCASLIDPTNLPQMPQLLQPVPRIRIQENSEDEESDRLRDARRGERRLEETQEIDAYESEEDYDSTPYSELLSTGTLTDLCARPTVAIWCLERALFTMVHYGIFMNIVDYMMVAIGEPLEKAALVTLSFGAGELIGFVAAVALGDHLPMRRQLQVFIGSTVATGIVLIIWQVLHSKSVQETASLIFLNSDAHLMTFATGLGFSLSNTYTFALAEEVTERPGHIAYPLTRAAQAIGLLLAPFTSAVLIEADGYHTFFLMQAILTLFRVFLLGILAYKMRAAAPSITSGRSAQNYETL